LDPEVAHFGVGRIEGVWVPFEVLELIGAAELDWIPLRPDEVGEVGGCVKMIIGIPDRNWW
jgi:hypothetical protein